MNERLRCAACGHEGYDVSTRIVENLDPTLVTSVPGAKGDYTVPARWISQLRCVNTEACRDRRPMSFDAEGTLEETP